MKFLKGFFSFIIGFIIFILISMLASSFLLKNVVQNQIMGSVVKSEMIEGIMKDSDIEHKEEIMNMLDDDELNYIVSDVMDEYLKAIENSNYEISDKTVDRIINYVDKHKEEIEKIAGEEIDVDELKMSKDEFNEEMNKSLSEEAIDSNVRDVFKVYKAYISTKFRIVLAVIIVVLIGLLMLINKNVYGWLTATGVSLIASGISMSGLYLLVREGLKQAMKESSVTIIIDPVNMLICGLIEMAVGVALLVTYNVINKKKQNKDEFEIESN